LKTPLPQEGTEEVLPPDEAEKRDEEWEEEEAVHGTH